MQELISEISKADPEERPFQGAQQIYRIYKEVHDVYEIYMKLAWVKPPVKGIVLEDDTVWWGKDKEAVLEVWNQKMSELKRIRTPYVRGADIGNYVIHMTGPVFAVERVTGFTEMGNIELDGKGEQDPISMQTNIVCLLEEAEFKQVEGRPAVLRYPDRLIAGFFYQGKLISGWPEGKVLGKFGRNELEFYEPVYRMTRK